ncbi:MAG TPA: FAD-binding oxidoreductase [Ktedonobacteraceae bacterium]|nr:FAD-binding oxidoreductase [Ktedonobacteraceae bacterium]
MGSISFWQTDFSPTNLPGMAEAPLRGKRQMDVAIVGGGITGVAAALWLARSGASVVLLEGQYLAAGASGRNAGFLANGTTGSYTATIARHGREKARRVWAFTIRNSQLVSELTTELAEQGWDCGYKRNGSLKLAASASELSRLREDEKLLQEDGWNIEPITIRDIPPRLRFFYRGGSYHPDNSEIHPIRYVAGIALLAMQAGATIYQESPVLSVAEDRQGVILTTPEGELRANALILATNKWLPELTSQLGAGWLEKCIKPTRGQVIATEPLEELIFPCPCSSDHGYQYWRQVNGRLIVGGWRNQSFETENTSDETPNQEIQLHIDAFVRQTLNLPNVDVVSRWAGIMGFSEDALPLVGRLPDTQHCYIAGAYTGHGNAYTIAAALMLSEMILGKTPADVDLFDPARFV